MPGVFEGNTFEGKTMLGVVHRFQERIDQTTPVIVVDAGMLSIANIQQLDAEGVSIHLRSTIGKLRKHSYRSNRPSTTAH